MKNHEFLDLLDARIEEIARAVFFEFGNKSSAEPFDDAPAKLRQQIALIKAKEHVTVKEAALLLSCSESHIRKLVMLARKSKTRRPIPYVDMEGLTIFPRESLLNWASPTSHRQPVKYEAA